MQLIRLNEIDIILSENKDFYWNADSCLKKDEIAIKACNVGIELALGANPDDNAYFGFHAGYYYFFLAPSEKEVLNDIGELLKPVAEDYE